MTEKGTLGIRKRGTLYHVHYASNNPYSTDEHQPYLCPSVVHLDTLLQSVGTDAWSVQHAFAELHRGGFVVMPIVLTPTQIHLYFPPLVHDKTRAGVSELSTAPATQPQAA